MTASPLPRSVLAHDDWLVIGGLHHLNGDVPVTGDDPIVLVPLPARPQAPSAAAWPSNTVIVRWAELGPLELYARTTDGARREHGRSTGAELFDRLLPGTGLASAVRAVTGPVTGPTGDAADPARAPWAKPLVPLFYVSSRDTGRGRAVHVYSQIRFLAEDACFIRLTPTPFEVGNTADIANLTWLADAVARHGEHFLFLNNHQRYYRKCFPDRELEYKYTFDPPTADIWTLTVRLYQRLLDGELDGYVPEYRDEFQAWDYANHLFQVTDPAPDRGYVSFIPTTDGKNLVKRKWFAADSFDRRESHTYGVTAAQGFEAYVRDELGVEAVRLPSFRRTRYDVNFESLRTGHVYGIFFDTVSLIDAPTVQLQQCELEYLRSRTVVEPDADAVLAEIAAIASWLEEFLATHRLNNERGFYSKLSFLLDSVAARPELARTVSADG
jgi:hypothetical protein